MNLLDIIAVTRDRHALSQEQIERVVRGAATGEASDYQLAAWLMAVVLNGLTDPETATLTMAMARSGDRIDLTGLPRPWLDKHSTGGVGDKATIVVLPILAACGLTAVKLSGRGLGITGGTIDKLESVPGFRIDLSPEEMIEQARTIGIALSGQSPRLAPADKVLYALRDATGTVRSLPLIVSSILCKKIAGGAERVVFDVKCGSGAFMKNLDEARKLADALRSVGEAAGLKVRWLITDMDQPLGRCCGNAIEVEEAIAVLAGRTGGRLRTLCEALAGTELELAGKAPDGQGARLAAEVIDNGTALLKAEAWFAAQGASVSIARADFTLERAPFQASVLAGSPGWVHRVDAGVIGQTVVDLGGGRKSKSDAVDPRVGVEVLVEVGDQVIAGQPLLILHGASEDGIQAVLPSAQAAVTIAPQAIPPRPVVLLD
ncbi:MAG: Pyrimidine-nucleoside phosphorylase [Fimbriimonadaceae bacterium]|nr:Pyrimidine-nucleoside phosphorylase [Fimbriimonadaceae bacterium]